MKTLTNKDFTETYHYDDYKNKSRKSANRDKRHDNKSTIGTDKSL